MKLIIIGAGPGGYTAAFAAADKGWDVFLVEDRKLGGTCLNHGCIPTKSMRASADALNLARRLNEYGVADCPNPQVIMAEVQKRKNRIMATLGGGLKNTCERLKVNLIEGKGIVEATGRVTIQASSGERILEGDAIILATGSDILELPGLAFDHKFILDSNDALELQEVPKSVIIVGGGVIGCELACIYHSFGSQVTIVEGQDRLLPVPSVDRDLSAFLAREMRKRKIRMLTGCTIREATVTDGICRATAAISPFVQPEASSIKEDTLLEAEKIFVTVGRKAGTPAVELAKADIKTDRRGWVEVNDRLETSLPGVYAVGDILGPAHVMLAHVAAMEGLHVVNSLAGDPAKMNYAAVPSAIFTEPELASVGLSESQAKETCDHVVCGVTQMRGLGKAQAMGELPGFCKIVADAKNGRILGVHIAGAHSSDLIAEATLAIARDVTVFELAQVIHAHPTLAEIIFETALETIREIKKANQ